LASTTTWHEIGPSGVIETMPVVEQAGAVRIGPLAVRDELGDACP
jgi:hypothetical protein